MNRHSQRGVALVITLIMLSVVTFMAIAFLALSRRERGAVSVSMDQTTASLMADTALARVESEIAARITVRTNFLSSEFMVSTNFINARGFDRALASISNTVPTNVNFEYLSDPNHLPLVTESDRNRNIANLQYDPRPPVFIDTNRTEPGLRAVAAPLDFRYFWDLNRNSQFEANGWQPVVAANGQYLLADGSTSLNRWGSNVVMNYVMGDPEWIGVLEKPGLPHSGTNKFIGRYAYLVLPVGKSLDINYIHNQAKRLFPSLANVSGYMRNQGVGSWELNLAGFLCALNTNQWPTNYYIYRRLPGQNSLGVTFDDARGILRYRYGSANIFTLNSVANLFGPLGAQAFTQDLVDGYTDGPLMSGTRPLLTDDDNPNRPWPGSDSTNVLFDAQALLNLGPAFGPTYLDFSNRLVGNFNPVTARSSYDRYTFYRLLSQMGVDSTTDVTNKLNINYQNYELTGGSNRFAAWTPIGFFTNAADRLIRAQLPYWRFQLRGYNATMAKLSVNYIPIYPTNYYSSAVHRMLQVAANIYDATTARYTADRDLPSVFRPVFQVTNGVNNVRLVNIIGYVEALDTAFLSNPWADMRNAQTMQAGVYSNLNVFGVPVVIGVKKGYPNFNEFALQTSVQVSRKLEISKDRQSMRPNMTNQLYIVGISNTFGVEAWNSYSNAFPRNLELRITNDFSIMLTNAGRIAPLAQIKGTVGMATNIAANTWTSNRFLVPINTNIYFLNDAAYFPRPPHLEVLNTNKSFDTTPGFPIPLLGLTITNRLTYILIDKQYNRVVDFVNMNNLGSDLDITSNAIGNQTILGEASSVGAFWQTNIEMNLPRGIRQQIQEALGQTSNSASLWQEYSHDPVSGRTRDKAIDLFRVFLGLQPTHGYRMADMNQELGNSLSHQVPFTPTRKIYQNLSWQVNDPLVHYLVQDITDWEQTNTITYANPPQRANTNSNLGVLNRKWRPWGGNPNISNDPDATNWALKDPMVRGSDDWEFPTNKLANVGWLGRVHRGTPWQTIYLKSTPVPTRKWIEWAGHPLTNSTNDWRILDLFTTAFNENAARGLLSVNQTNLAAWSAVLSGVSVLTNSNIKTYPPTNVTEMFIEPGSVQLQYIVDGINRARLTNSFNQSFQNLSDILTTPELTVASPYLSSPRRAGLNVNDAVVERIPQQIMSLLKVDDPRVVVYAYGQALRPAGPPVLDPGKWYNRMYTNYTISGEVLTKYMLRVEGTFDQPRIVRERFQYLPND